LSHLNDLLQPVYVTCVVDSLHQAGLFSGRLYYGSCIETFICEVGSNWFVANAWRIVTKSGAVASFSKQPLLVRQPFHALTRNETLLGCLLRTIKIVVVSPGTDHEILIHAFVAHVLYFTQCGGRDLLDYVDWMDNEVNAGCKYLASQLSSDAIRSQLAGLVACQVA